MIVVFLGSSIQMQGTLGNIRRLFWKLKAHGGALHWQRYRIQQGHASRVAALHPMSKKRRVGQPKVEEELDSETMEIADLWAKMQRMQRKHEEDKMRQQEAACMAVIAKVDDLIKGCDAQLKRGRAAAGGQLARSVDAKYSEFGTVRKRLRESANSFNRDLAAAHKRLKQNEGRRTSLRREAEAGMQALKQEHGRQFRLLQTAIHADLDQLKGSIAAMDKQGRLQTRKLLTAMDSAVHAAAGGE